VNPLRQTQHRYGAYIKGLLLNIKSFELPFKISGKKKIAPLSRGYNEFREKSR
jgi:hypothetical protein